MVCRVLTHLALLVAGLVGGPALAQTPLLGPQEVVLYVHSDLETTDFVDQLVCELSRVLVAPVRAQEIHLPLDIGLMASSTQIAADKLAARFFQATAGDGGSRTFRFLLVPYDLRGGNYRYVFAASFGPPYNGGVVSTARLAPNPTGSSRAQAARITLDRTYKVILRYVGQISGLWTSNGCVLAMPRGIDELDNKSREFCDGDRVILVDAGILKARPGSGCTPIASIIPGAIALR